jgi:hypothetical protein
MISRIWAVLRTIYLVFILGYVLWATPLMPMSVARTFDEQYARCANALGPLQRAAWLGVAWIALEVIVGWLGVWRSAHADRSKLQQELREARRAPPAPPAP